jgi:hypothetical protein
MTRSCRIHGNLVESLVLIRPLKDNEVDVILGPANGLLFYIAAIAGSVRFFVLQKVVSLTIHCLIMDS